MDTLTQVAQEAPADDIQRVRESVATRFPELVNPVEATCTTCGQPASAPYRRYDKTGRVLEGCVSPEHTGHLLPGSQSANFHDRIEAKTIRGEVVNPDSPLLTGKLAQDNGAPAAVTASAAPSSPSTTKPAVQSTTPKASVPAKAGASAANALPTGEDIEPGSAKPATGAADAKPVPETKSTSAEMATEGDKSVPAEQATTGDTKAEINPSNNGLLIAAGIGAALLLLMSRRPQTAAGQL